VISLIISFALHGILLTCVSIKSYSRNKETIPVHNVKQISIKFSKKNHQQNAKYNNTSSFNTPNTQNEIKASNVDKSTKENKLLTQKRKSDSNKASKQKLKQNKLNTKSKLHKIKTKQPVKAKLSRNSSKHAIIINQQNTSLTTKAKKNKLNEKSKSNKTETKREVKTQQNAQPLKTEVVNQQKADASKTENNGHQTQRDAKCKNVEKTTAEMHATKDSAIDNNNNNNNNINAAYHNTNEEIENDELAEAEQAIKQAIKEKWHVPIEFAGCNISIVIDIRTNSEGEIVQYAIKEIIGKINNPTAANAIKTAAISIFREKHIKKLPKLHRKLLNKKLRIIFNPQEIT
jgi:hypothetical protein